MSGLSGRAPVGARLIAIVGGLSFAASLAYFSASYAGRFGRETPRTPAENLLVPVAVDVALFTAFALHHSIFARSGLKAAIARRVSDHLERSLYVLVASALLALTCFAWQPVPGVLWRLDGASRDIAIAVEAGAALMTLVAARQLGVLALAGVSQVWGGSDAPPKLDDTGLYGIVRHPIYLAWFVLVWIVPVMTATRLVFAATSCAYLALAVPFEERDLRRLFGAAYDTYKGRVRWRIIPGVY
jgi:protein-S-isoprenylcysteine O-methyltransferase Ste14